MTPTFLGLLMTGGLLEVPVHDDTVGQVDCVPSQYESVLSRNLETQIY